MKPFIGAQSPYYSRFIRWDNKAIESGRTSLDPKDCPTHTILQQGIEFIRRNASRRFFALISIPEPHPPYIAPEPYYSRIEPDVVPATSFRDSTRFWQGKNPGWVEHYRAIWEKISRSELQRALATYCAKIEFLDAEFGRLRQTLEQEGILDETLLVYLSDHGDMAGLGGVLGKSGLMYDPVLRQPLVLRYPPLGAAGLKVDALLESVDVAPTLLDLLGVQVPSSFQGKVSTQVLRGGRPLREDVVTLMAAALARMARTRRHKLIVYADGFQELYDLEQDPLEMDNRRSTADPALVRDLEARLQRAG
jgi:arylsulfatase A-like enzyme